MTGRHSIFRSHAAEPGLRWMLAVSLAVHLALCSLFMGKPPGTPKKVFFSPVYSVSLVDQPPASAPVRRPGQGKRDTSLWEGPGPLSSQVKVLEGRKHTTLTISRKDTAEGGATPKRSTAVQKQSKPGPSGGGTGARTHPGAAGTKKEPTGGPQGAASLDSLRYGRYYEAVWNKIKQAWILPGSGSGTPAEAIVVIRINRNGRITNMDFEKKSGNSALDRSVIRAIKKADPLPPLPAAFKEHVLELGIRFIPGS